VFVIVYTSSRIHQTIKRISQDASNRHALEIHRQVTRLLIVQAMLPLLSFILPLALLIVFAVLRINFPMLGFYTHLTLIWFISLKVCFA
jgi:hypothetical protein